MSFVSTPAVPATFDEWPLEADAYEVAWTPNASGTLYMDPPYVDAFAGTVSPPRDGGDAFAGTVSPPRDDGDAFAGTVRGDAFAGTVSPPRHEGARTAGVWYAQNTVIDQHAFAEDVPVTSLLASLRLAAETHIPVASGATDFLRGIASNLVHLRERDSASGSIFMRGRLVGHGRQRVFVKAQRIGLDNSGDVEAEVYMAAMNVMILDNITPHTIACVAYIRTAHMRACLSTADYLPEGIPWGLLHNLDVRNDEEFGGMMRFDDAAQESVTLDYREGVLQEWDALGAPTDQGSLLILHDACHATTLGALVRGPIEPPMLVSILMQLLYTLEAFSRASPPVRHNDLHAGNILVTKVDAVDLVYVVDEAHAYRVPTNGCFAHVFDFDHAYHGVWNTKLDAPWMCSATGSCNADNPYFDTFFLMKRLYKEAFHLDKNHPLPNGASRESAFPPLVRYGPRFAAWLNDFSQDTSAVLYKSHARMCHTVRDATGVRVCDGEIRAGELKKLKLPTTKELIESLGYEHGFRCDMATVSMRSPTTFFADAQLRARMQAGAVKQPQHVGRSRHRS